MPKQSALSWSFFLWGCGANCTDLTCGDGFNPDWALRSVWEQQEIKTRPLFIHIFMVTEIYTKMLC